MTAREVLMVGLRRIKSPAFDSSGDWRLVDMRSIEARDERLGEPSLVGRLREDGGPIAVPDIRTLAVDLGGIMSDREIDLQQSCIADLRRVIGDPHGLGMAGAFGAN